jgi:O-antigen/teichoic acid export membrane protein
MNNKFAQATARGVFWTYSSFYIGKVMVLISTVILARLLVKSDFGVVSFALLIIGFLDTINSAGISSALIYYQDDENALYNSAFWLNLAVGGVMFAGTWLLAPLAGNYFDDIRVVSFTQALAFVFLLNSLEDIPKAILTKNLSFNVRFLPDTLHAIFKGVVSILCAFLGFEAWSLVIGQLSGAFASLITYWIIVPWRPKFEMTIQWIRSIFSYGIGIVATNLLSYILVNIDYLFVGYFLGAAALGVYTIAFRIPDLLIVQFCSLVGRVIFPVFVKLKNDPDALKEAFLKTMNYVSLITIPLGLGLMLVTKPFVLTVFTDKWSEAIPVMRAIALYALFLSLAYNATHAYKARGAISLMTSISTVRAAILIPALWWASSQIGSIEAIAWTHAVIAFIGCSINIIMAGRVMNASLASIMRTLRSPLIAGAVMSIVVLGILYITSSLFPWVQLITGIAAGVLSYTVMLAWIQKGIFMEAWKIFQSSMSTGSQ